MVVLGEATEPAICAWCILVKPSFDHTSMSMPLPSADAVLSLGIYAVGLLKLQPQMCYTRPDVLRGTDWYDYINGSLQTGDVPLISSDNASKAIVDSGMPEGHASVQQASYL